MFGILRPSPGTERDRGSSKDPRSPAPEEEKLKELDELSIF